MASSCTPWTSATASPSAISGMRTGRRAWSAPVARSTPVRPLEKSDVLGPDEPAHAPFQLRRVRDANLGPIELNHPAQSVAQHQHQLVATLVALDEQVQLLEYAQ